MGTATHTQDQEEQARRLRAAMERVDHLVEELGQKVAAADGSAGHPVDPKPVLQNAKSLETAIAAPEFQPEYRRGVQTKLRDMQRMICEKSVDHMLDVAMIKLRERDVQGRDAMLARAREDYSMAVKFGSGAGFRDLVRRKIAIINQSSPPGDSAKAKQDRITEEDRKPVDPERANRRFVRFCDPVLTIMLDGHEYDTIDWSMNGLLLDRYLGETPTPKALLKMIVSVKGDKLTVPLAGHAVKHSLENKTLSIHLTGATTEFLPLMDRMRTMGMKPIQA